MNARTPLFANAFQQYRLCRVPVKCLRQIVVHLGRNDAPVLVTILETAIDRAPPCEELAGITFPLPLGSRKGSLCGKGRLAGRNADGVRHNFP